MNETFANYIRTEEITFKHARGMRDIVGEEFHQYHEIFLFQQKRAEFISEKQRYILRPNTLVIIPKHTFHRFEPDGDESDYGRCVLNFAHVAGLQPLIEEKMRSIQVIPATEETLRLIARLTEECHRIRAPHETDLLLKSCLVLILLEIQPQAAKSAEGEYIQFSRTTREALRFINKNLSADLRIASIAEGLHISISHLNHSFKRDLHISIHKYILDKRLIEANRRIACGAAPTQAAEQCGFADYSGFYRQYKKRFHISPSDKTRKFVPGNM